MKNAEVDVVVRVTNAGVQVKQPGQTWATAGPPVSFTAIRWQQARMQAQENARPKKVRRSVV